MRNRFDEKLFILNKKLIEMGSLCEDIIEISSNALINGKNDRLNEVKIIGNEIDIMEEDIEAICLKLLLLEHPVAGDLRQISAALKMITDMERIGDQAEDIADIIEFLNGRTGEECEEIRKMAETSIKMVRDSIDAYVNLDLELARSVYAFDDIVDDCFIKTKNRLINMIVENKTDGEYPLDLLMISKYFERIGDHAVNIAEWVEYSITGVHKDNNKD